MPSKKWLKKNREKKCFFCGEKDMDLLDAHRIIPNSEGGKYVEHNMIVCCALCHRKCHSGRIQVHGRHFSTSGRYVIHYTEDGVEHWKS